VPQPTANDQIFISIAAYRDSQIVPTVEDCLQKAQQPERLRFGICWQHDATERLGSWQEDVRFRILDVDWRDSAGACWARAQVMNLWQGERWFFQVDSHCRFAHHWDARLIGMMAQTGSAKPILSTYATAFTPGKSEVLAGVPLLMALQGFTAEGIPHMKPLSIHDWRSRDRPLRARFLSAGFLFASGSLVRDVPYDPELYFLGEEAAMTVRAFTHGYDLFHPVEIIVWHDYERRNGVRHWHDHTEANRALVDWGERDLLSKAKVRKLLHGEPAESFSLGSVRTLAEYEAYAGLSFQLRRAQDYTTRAEEPPNPPAPADWTQEIVSWMVRIRLRRADLPEDLDDTSSFYIGVFDELKTEIYRRDLSPAEVQALPLDEAEIVLVCEFQSGSIPTGWLVWPVSRTLGWQRRIEQPFAEGDYAVRLDNEA
jgi:Glycosyltransferase (GlcNAc)